MPAPPREGRGKLEAAPPARSIRAATASFGIGHNCLFHREGHNQAPWLNGVGQVPDAFWFDGVEQAFRPAVKLLSLPASAAEVTFDHSSSRHNN